jgi:hypothetical protein
MICIRCGCVSRVVVQADNAVLVYLVKKEVSCNIMYELVLAYFSRGRLRAGGSRGGRPAGGFLKVIPTVIRANR